MSKARLHAWYRQATAVEREQGITWYADARLEACELADRYGVELGTAAGVIAALSPNSQWSQNLTDADTVLSSRDDSDAFYSVKVTTYNANKRKAFDIAHSEKVFPTLSGPKVTAFYYNICGDLSETTVDSHIINAWFGYRRTGGKLSGVAKSIIDRISSDVRHCARHYGLQPAQFQAIIWLVWIRRIESKQVRGYEK